MSGLSGVGSIAVAYATVAMSPGTNLLVVSRFGLAGRREEACSAALGVATGVALVAGVIFTGSHWLSSLPSIAAVLQAAFAAILFKLGTTSLWRACRQPRPEAGRTTPIGRRSFVVGLMTAITNPVTAGFFLGLAADQASRTETRQVIMVACAIFAVAASWFCLVALVFSHPRLRSGFDRFRSVLDAAAGCLLIALGLVAGSRLLV